MLLHPLDEYGEKMPERIMICMDSALLYLLVSPSRRGAAAMPSPGVAFVWVQWVQWHPRFLRKVTLQYRICTHCSEGEMKCNCTHTLKFLTPTL